MAYSDFTLPKLKKQFGLTLSEDVDLYAHVSPVSPDPPFLTRLAQNGRMAKRIGTEKARSEWMIAPVLSEARLIAEENFGLFSGVDFSVDAAQGLIGVCDFIVTRSPEQLFVQVPVLMLVEAKNEDMKRGYAQCAAEMIAARHFNTEAEDGPTQIYGVVTTGDRWQFLVLEDSTLHIDLMEYPIEQVGKILGILLHLVN